LFTTGNKQVRKKRHVAATSLISDVYTSVRTLPNRRVKFPPLQFVGEGAETATEAYIMQSHVTESVVSPVSVGDTSYDLDSDLCSEHGEQEAAEMVEDLQLTKQHSMTSHLAVEHCEHLPAADSKNSCSDELTAGLSVCLKPLSRKVDGRPSGSDYLTDGGIADVNNKELKVAAKSLDSDISQKQDLTMCAENVSAVNYDINTPTCDIEPSDCNEGLQREVDNVATETATSGNVSCVPDRNSVEPVHVLSFSRIDRSVDETEHPVRQVICAAELNEDMSELLDKDEETSLNAPVNCRQSFCHDRHEFFSTLNSLTPLEYRCKDTVLVSDTPLNDYGLSYRQRELKAGNIRLRHRTDKS